MKTLKELAERFAAAYKAADAESRGESIQVVETHAAALKGVRGSLPFHYPTAGQYRKLAAMYARRIRATRAASRLLLAALHASGVRFARKTRWGKWRRGSAK